MPKDEIPAREMAKNPRKNVSDHLGDKPEPVYKQELRIVVHLSDMDPSRNRIRVKANTHNTPP